MLDQNCGQNVETIVTPWTKLSPRAQAPKNCPLKNCPFAQTGRTAVALATLCRALLNDARPQLEAAPLAESGSSRMTARAR